jgi:hypothetical protein
MAVLREQVVRMRQWMKNHGQQNKPLILSEFSILYPYETDPAGCFLADEFGNCFTEARVQQFMTNTFNYLENEAHDVTLGYPADNYRLVQQWLWFSVFADGAGAESNLMSANQTTLTPLGQLFKSYVHARPQSVNLLPERASHPLAFANGGAANVNISIEVRNNGNVPASSFTVKFYSQNPTNNPGAPVIGQTVVNTAGGCARRPFTASTIWSNLSAGKHTYWALVDSGNQVSESVEGDNLIAGFVLVDPQQTFLPFTPQRLP